jgi:amino acid transporter
MRKNSTFIEKIPVPFSSLYRKKPVDQILAEAHAHEMSQTGMRRSLTVVDLTALGIAAIIGTGIFATIGDAAVTGGPAVALLFIFTAIACGFSALCYAEFASVIPLSGSAYTYAYASFGELLAWIIGWDLIIEYAIGNIAVAISWSDYFTGFLSGMGVHFPEYFSIDYLTALRGNVEALKQMAGGVTFSALTADLQDAYLAWQHAPVIGSLRIIADVPAFSIVVLITTLVYVGIYETKMVGNAMVLLKVVVLLVVIGVGAFYVDPGNWSPFAPHGLGGVLKGVSGVFFAYIGFDAISTTAEECRNTRRDLPRAILWSLLITTVLYVLVALVLTGMVNYKELAVGDPLAFVFQKLHLTRLAGIIALAAIVAMASVILVFQVGQPRIWMSMSRDGLLPKAFSRIHPKFKTPSFATLVTGLLVAIPALFMNFTEVTDLTSIGTLFAFVLVSGGILVLNPRPVSSSTRTLVTTFNSSKGFRVPYINSRYFLPFIWIGVFFIFWYWNPPEIRDFVSVLNPQSSAAPSFSLSGLTIHEIPFILFLIVAVMVTVAAIVRQYTLIPVLGLLTNLYLMVHLGVTNWLRFLIWLAAGLLIYFLYSRKHSKLK